MRLQLLPLLLLPSMTEQLIRPMLLRLAPLRSVRLYLQQTRAPQQRLTTVLLPLRMQL